MSRVLRPGVLVFGAFLSACTSLATLGPADGGSDEDAGSAQDAGSADASTVGDSSLSGSDGSIADSTAPIESGADSGLIDAGVDSAVAPTCSDGLQNGAETGIDCGGGTCGKCADGAGCVDGTQDCMDGVCTGGVCAAPTCSDGAMNGAETGIDCGGGTCLACAAGGGCAAPSDCMSGVCSAGTCASATCSDGVKNGNESDVDCGGACTACGTGYACNAPGDCMSDVCAGNICQAATCTDGVENQDETGVDCGGATCPACPVVCLETPVTVAPPTTQFPFRGDVTLPNGTFGCKPDQDNPGPPSASVLQLSSPLRMTYWVAHSLVDQHGSVTIAQGCAASSSVIASAGYDCQTHSTVLTAGTYAFVDCDHFDTVGYILEADPPPNANNSCANINKVAAGGPYRVYNGGPLYYQFEAGHKIDFLSNLDAGSFHVDIETTCDDVTTIVKSADLDFCGPSDNLVTIPAGALGTLFTMVISNISPGMMISYTDSAH